MLAHPQGSAITLTVTPRASYNGLELLPDKSLRAHVTAPPVDGAANVALLKLLARTLGISRSRLTIAAGAGSRHKRIVVAGLSPDDLERELRKVLAKEQ